MSPRPTLHDYQHVGVEHLHRNPRAGLFMDMGLGKTATVLSALTPEHLPALVVAPKRVAEETWHVERKLWRPDLSLAQAVGNPLARQRAIMAHKDITVVSRDNIKDVTRERYRTIILDELSGFKARTSNRWKLGRLLTAKAENVWGLTGTPAPNGYLDLWAQVYLLDGGQRLTKYITHYRQRYFIAGRSLPNGVVTEWILRDGAEDEIKAKIEDICLSMETDGRVQLPPITWNPVPVSLPSKAMRAYQTLKKDLVLGVELLGSVHTADTAAALSNRLSQISAGFIYGDVESELEGTAVHIHNEKTVTLREIVDGTGSPVLVFYRYRPEFEAIMREFPNARDIREKGTVEAWNKGDIPVLVAHPASAGHGLNLQHGGHTIVWTSLPWSLEEWQQANKRLARQGQKHPVVIHMLLANKTIDHDILKALEGKTSVQQALLDHLESVL
jgi:SNF2 family DNA or RNA helicase